MQHIFEHADAMFDVSYLLVKDEPVFQSVHLLDGGYQRVGPDLKEFFHRIAIINGEPVNGQPVDACTFLSAICEELPHESQA